MMPLLRGQSVRGEDPVVATNQRQTTIRHQRCKCKAAAAAATRNGRQTTVCFPERRASTVNGQQMTTVACVHDSQIVIGRPSQSRAAAEVGCLRPFSGDRARLRNLVYCSDHWRFFTYVQPSTPRASVKPRAPISINRRLHSSGSAPVTLERVSSERPSGNLELSSICLSRFFLRLSRELALRF